MTKQHSVLVFERRRFWTPELQRRLAGRSVAVKLCGSATDVLHAIPHLADPVLILPLRVRAGQPSSRDCLNLQRRVFGQVARVFSLVLADDSTASLECTFRELSVSSFSVSHVSGSQLAALCERQWHPFAAVRR